MHIVTVRSLSTLLHLASLIFTGVKMKMQVAAALVKLQSNLIKLNNCQARSQRVSLKPRW